MRAQDSQDPDDWGLIGSHDSDPAMKMIKKDWVRGHDAWNIFYLAGFLNSNPARAKFRDEFCKKIDNDDRERVKAKFAELFLTCKRFKFLLLISLESIKLIMKAVKKTIKTGN